MTRFAAVVALLTLPAVGSAQFGGPPSGPLVLNGRSVVGPPIGNAGAALFPVQIAEPPRFSAGGGSLSAPPQIWVPSGAWGGVSYPWPVDPLAVEPAPVSVGGARPAVSPPIVLSGRTNATLVVQLPAAAEIWVGGKKVVGPPLVEWTLTAPDLWVGESHTFELKGRWQSGGKTFETTRSLSVRAGERSRAVVVSGTEVKE